MPVRRSTRVRRLLAPLTLLVFAACASGGPLSPGERRDLDRAEQLWASRRPASYTFETRRNCFCPPGMEAWTELLVRGDSIVSSNGIEVARNGGQPVPLSYWSTVPALFAIVRQAAGEPYVKRLDVEYDAEYGYPRRIEIGCAENVTDCGVVYEARNLKPAP